MDTSVMLQPPFSYPKWMLVVAIVTLSVVIVANVLLRVILPGKLKKRQPREKAQQAAQTTPYFDINESKWRHTARLDRLARAYAAGQVTSRVAHEEISRVARSFVHEATKVDVQDWTLEEIRRSPYAALAELISICYEPEFAEHSEADPLRSIEHAKAVIWSWA